jgi:hypothetical protein
VSKSCLPNSPRPYEGDKTFIVQQVGNVGELLLPANDRCSLGHPQILARRALPSIRPETAPMKQASTRSLPVPSSKLEGISCGGVDRYGGAGKAWHAGERVDELTVNEEIDVGVGPSVSE